MPCHTVNQRDAQCAHRPCTTPLACDAWKVCRIRKFGEPRSPLAELIDITQAGPSETGIPVIIVHDQDNCEYLGRAETFTRAGKLVLDLHRTADHAISRQQDGDRRHYFHVTETPIEGRTAAISYFIEVDQ